MTDCFSLICGNIQLDTGLKAHSSKMLLLMTDDFSPDFSTTPNSTIGIGILFIDDCWLQSLFVQRYCLAAKLLQYIYMMICILGSLMNELIF